MFDVSKINEYREGNRFEVKKAQNDLPSSIWETYSAFANSDGGVILLGVIEHKDGLLFANGIPNPEAMIKKFWDIINNRQKVSLNILRNKNIYIDTMDGKTIIVIEVPRAMRQDRPIYINNDLKGGVYRRNGEGDYHCTESEIKNMIRDSRDVTQDRMLLDNFSLDALNLESVSRYRMRFKLHKPNHVWLPLIDEEFLQKIGAVKRSSEDGNLHPTVAGLLMFGNDTEIVNEFSNYFLDYREPFDAFKTRWTDRVTSGTGEWSGNLFDFYYRIQDRLTSDIKVPFALNNEQERIDETAVHVAIREALANAIVHSDYSERRGLVIEKLRDSIIIANPGSLRIPKEEALNGGVSDPRNSALFSMFSLIGICERAGSGLASIKSVWKKNNFPEPQLSEQFNPDRTILTLHLAYENVGDNVGDSVGDNVGENVGEKNIIKLTKNERRILELIKEDGTLTIAEIASKLNINTRTIERGLIKLKNNGIIKRIGSDRAGFWVITDLKLRR